MHVIGSAGGGVVLPAAAPANPRNDGFSVDSLLGLDHDRWVFQSIPFNALPVFVAADDWVAGLVLSPVDRAALIAVQPRAIGAKGDVIGQRGMCHDWSIVPVMSPPGR